MVVCKKKKISEDRFSSEPLGWRKVSGLDQGGKIFFKHLGGEGFFQDSRAGIVSSKVQGKNCFHVTRRLLLFVAVLRMIVLGGCEVEMKSNTLNE